MPARLAIRVYSGDDMQWDCRMGIVYGWIGGDASKGTAGEKQSLSRW